MDEHPKHASAVKERHFKEATSGKRLDDMKSGLNEDCSMGLNFLPTINTNSGKEPKLSVNRENIKALKTEAKTDKAKIAVSRGKPEKQRMPDFLRKWDWPDLQSSRVERSKKRKEITKSMDENNLAQGSDKKMEALNAQISWIYEESSESDTETNELSPHQENKDGQNTKKKGPFDDKFRDHLMKELLKQGKDMKWFMAGAKKALDKLEKEQQAKDPGIQSTVRVSQELNQFLTRSMRPYYQEKKKEKRKKK